MISPKAAIWLNVIYGVLTALTSPALEAVGVSAGDAGHVVGWAALAAIPLNLLLHAYSANVAGPAVK